MKGKYDRENKEGGKVKETKEEEKMERRIERRKVIQRGKER